MFTQSHHIFLARFFKDWKYTFYDNTLPYYDDVTLASIITDLADRLKRDNTTFDKETFFIACGIEK